MKTELCLYLQPCSYNEKGYQLTWTSKEASWQGTLIRKIEIEVPEIPLEVFIQAALQACTEQETKQRNELNAQLEEIANTRSKLLRIGNLREYNAAPAGGELNAGAAYGGSTIEFPVGFDPTAEVEEVEADDVEFIDLKDDKLPF